MVASAKAAPAPRPISMEECLNLALEHNLDIRIQRITPRLASLSLYGTYAAYDPSLSGSFSHSDSASPSGVDPQGRPYTPTESRKDAFNFALSGLGPLGETYRLGASMNDTYGTRPGLAADPFNPVWSTNAFTFLVPTNLAGQQATVISQGPGVMTVVNGFRTADAFAGLTLTQPLMKNFWIDDARLSITLRRHDLKSSEQDFRQTVIATVSGVQTAFYNLIAARETVTVQIKALELAEELLRENHKRVEVGVLAPLDEKQAESQVAASRADLLGAQNSARTAQNALKSLISDRFESWKDVELEPTEKLSRIAEVLNRQDSWSKGLTMRPELIKARIDLQKRNVTLRYDRNQLYPQLDLTGSFGLAGSATEFSGALGGVTDRENPAFSFGVQFAMPLSRRAARTAYRMDKEALEQALLSLKKLEQGIMIEIDNAIATAQTRFQQVEATGAAVVYAEAAVDAERKKLDNGKSTNFQVISLQRDLSLRRYEGIAAMVGYNTALVSLAQSEGATLERSRINLEIK